ncbi:orotidine-5'-phosphate decarboxylase [Aquibacillus kalidii]|uniref:orotidine-5'-phosphate decarboxylase n=1 Tax=Aquibacillus kalidii TaxID=2762597 RepID=UPI0016489D1D|nr:orotidine-5'-phosphate decarboxylase [Aquibacillus kalidii]
MDTRIYLALDFPDWSQSKRFLQENELKGVPVKVGMELFYKEGPSVIEQLKKDNHSIFLDLKLHDIPTTVQKAMRNIAQLGVDIINVHALGGSDMIEAAKQGLIEGASGKNVPKLIGVTVLTSMDEQMLQGELNVNATLEETAVRLAKLIHSSGGDGVVCSAHEAALIKEACSPEFLTVTPGIRLTNTAHNDQKRIATPKFAKENGSDILVIGRSITQSTNPKQAYYDALEELKHD